MFTLYWDGTEGVGQYFSFRILSKSDIETCQVWDISTEKNDYFTLCEGNS